MARLTRPQAQAKQEAPLQSQESDKSVPTAEIELKETATGDPGYRDWYNR